MGCDIRIKPAENFLFELAKLIILVVELDVSTEIDLPIRAAVDFSA